MDICDKKANLFDSLFYVTGLSVARWEMIQIENYPRIMSDRFKLANDTLKK
jgi:hypothetical protein